MVLLFDPDPPSLQWCLAEDGCQGHGTCRIAPGWAETMREETAQLGSVGAIGYVLRHGGDEIVEPLSLLTPQSLETLRRSIRFLPEHNSLSFAAIECGLTEFPGVPHVLLCDTALFANLPREASTYAVPYALRKAGVRRYGGFGLCHWWAYEQANELADCRLGKVLSVYLANRTNIAAIQNGRAVETTIGFTPAEGIVSSTGCGDIDPTIVFQLESTGLSFQEMNRLLSGESGLSGLVGRRCTVAQIVGKTDDRDVLAASRLFRYHILKQIGAFTAVLGGVDAIVFVTEHPDELLPFVRALSEELRFTGYRPDEELRGSENLWRLSTSDSPVKVFCLRYNKWKTFATMASKILC